MYIPFARSESQLLSISDFAPSLFTTSFGSTRMKRCAFAAARGVSSSSTATAFRFRLSASAGGSCSSSSSFFSASSS